MPDNLQAADDRDGGYRTVARCRRNAQATNPGAASHVGASLVLMLVLMLVLTLVLICLQCARNEVCRVRS